MRTGLTSFIQILVCVAITYQEDEIKLNIIKVF